MNPQNYTINIRPGWGISPVVKVSQGDVGRPLDFTIMDGQDALTIASGTTVTIKGTKPSTLGFTQACELSGNTASVETTATMTQEAGAVQAELILTQGTTIIGSANFIMYVEPAAHPEGTTDGDAETARDLMTRAQAAVEQAEAEADRAEEAAESIAQAGISTAGATAGQVPTANGDGSWSWQDQQGGGGTSDDIENKSSVSGATVTDALDSLSDEIANEQTTRASADESLRKAIDNLVSPSGQSVVVDSSLSIQGAAADAKKTGDELSDIKEVLGDLSDLETTDKSSIVAAINEAAQSGGSSTGITNAVKQALLACFQNVAWATEDGQDYYDALLASMEVPATAISVMPSTASFYSASETKQLIALVTPRDSSDTVTWISSDSSVATVSNAGLVTPIANGSCTITATAGNVSATCSVTVSGIVRSFDVVNSLTHATNSNPSTRVAEGDSYTATLSADNGYWLTNAVVTMGGEDITSTAYDNGTISIAEVTGEITIYAIAKEITIITTNWTRGLLGNTGSYVNQKWYGAEVTDMITMGADQTLVIYSTDPNWTTNYTGTAGGGKTGNNSLCCFYHNASSPSYINPVITVTDEKSILTFSSDTSKVPNYSKTIGARVHVSNLVDNLSSVVVGLIDGVV